MFTNEELTFNNTMFNSRGEFDKATNIAAEYIRDNWNLLENKDFNQFYTEAYSHISGPAIAIVNYFLLKSRIDPIDYLDFIPANYCSWLNIKSYTVPNHITKIRGCAFWNCDKLENIVIPNHVIEIGNFAFSYCYKLESISISKRFKDKIERGSIFEDHPDSAKFIYT